MIGAGQIRRGTFCRHRFTGERCLVLYVDGDPFPTVLVLEANCRKSEWGLTGFCYDYEIISDYQSANPALHDIS